MCTNCQTKMYAYNSCAFLLQLYEIDDNPKRREFLDDLFAFMQKRGKSQIVFVFALYL